MHVSLAALGELMVGATGLEGVDPEIIDVSLLTSGWNYFQLLPLLCLRAPVSAHRRVCVCIVCVCVRGGRRGRRMGFIVGLVLFARPEQ